MAAIYQTARPANFDQVVGQEHVKEVLLAALKRGRIGHAYLFSGPRGVGKTTTARLLAMAVNCSAEEPEARPCGECDSCLLVRRGSHPDVIELDAASNNSVDDIRDLREKVRLSSVRGGRRVWVLDEAHMLSKPAANALLKTLEEPPEGLVFVLATTEPEKLPPTILSRTQHFRFRRLSEPEIAGKLVRLCEEAGVKAEDAALTLVARAADGAMRDAESLLERLLTSDEPITRARAESALGLPSQDRMDALAGHLAEGDLNSLFAEAGALYADGFSPRSLSEQLQLTLRDALYRKVGVSTEGADLRLEQDELLRLIHALDEEDERFARHNDLFSLEVALIKACNALRNNVPSEALHEHARSGGAADGHPARTEAAGPEVNAGSGLADFDPNGRDSPAPPQPSGRPARPEEGSPRGEPAPKAGGDPAPARKLNWRDLMREAQQPLRAYLHDASADVEGQDLFLSFQHDFHFKRTQEMQNDLLELIRSVSGETVKIHLMGPGDTRRKKS